jgi:hypothetical protein
MSLSSAFRLSLILDALINTMVNSESSLSQAFMC